MAPFTVCTKGNSTKAQALLFKVPCYDCILDYYHLQALLLKKDIARTKINVPVFSFLTNLRANDSRGDLLLDDPHSDVYVVGTLSRRRRQIYDKLRDLGYRLSPYSTDRFAEVVSRSRVTLNVHFQSWNSFEALRVIEVMARRRCLVTEPCPGLERLVPPSCYCSVDYRQIIAEVDWLLRNPRVTQEIAERGTTYVPDVYSARSEQCWNQIMTQIETMSRLQFRTTGLK